MNEFLHALFGGATILLFAAAILLGFLAGITVMIIWNAQHRYPKNDGEDHCGEENL